MDKLNIFIDELNNDKEVNRFIELKSDLLNNEDLLAMIAKVKTNPDDLETKRKILTDKRYIEYKELENKLYFLSLKINQLIKDFAREGNSYACHKW